MDRDEALRLLRGGPDGLLEWILRRGRGEEIPDLSGADLSEADLHGADLRGADLSGADLNRAYLGGTNLDSARCGFTVFGGVDLSEAKGLELIEHRGPSLVGVDTLAHSRGRFPEAFLRGCGVPEAWIEYLPTLLGMLEPIQFYSCFISHSSADKDFARRLHSRMCDEGLRVWFDEEDIKGGRELHPQIDEAIRAHDKLLLVLSEASLGSTWVRTELRRAWLAERREGARGRKLFPIRLVGYDRIKAWSVPDSTGEDLAEEVRKFFIPDFTRWKNRKAFETVFARLLRDLQAEEQTPK
jgi:hypothetical protein